MKLVVSLATRGRPQQLIDTITKSSAHITLPETVIMVHVDDDDQPTIDALNNAALPRKAFATMKVTVGPREDTIAAKWNRALREPADVYLVSADDAPEATPGFDAKIIEAAQRFPDGIGVVYGHLANLSFPSIMAPTAKFCEKLGHIFPELFPYWFVDHWIDDIARITGRISFADTRTDQSRVGATQEMRETAWWATFFDAAYLMRRQIAHALIKDNEFQASDWQRDLLLTVHPLVEVRSRMINETVRAQSRDFAWANRHLSLVDPRYQRVKQKALDMVPQLLDGYGMQPAEAAQYRHALLVPTTIQSIPRVGG